MDTQKVLKFLENFSVITVGENKVPNFGWTKQQTEKLDVSKLTYRLEYKGGQKWTDESGITHEVKPTHGFGLVTGFEDLEVFDIDLKVFSTAQEKVEFWDEYFNMLKDNIIDFEEKFAIYKTKKEGFHILYKSKRVQGNTKVAKLKGHKEAIIETRGKWGYVFAYPENKVSKRSYFEVDYISDKDREMLFEVSGMYNHIEEKPIEPEKRKTEFITGEFSPWEDYNNKTSIWDVIDGEFSIPRNGNKSKWTLIKRHGSTAEHSGYIFKDSGCMFLFTTGTIYPHEKLITPFIAYTWKYHNGNFKEAASELYKLGFGSRIEKKIQEASKSVPDNSELIEKHIINSEDLIFPIDIFPKPMQNYIMECNQKLDSNIDYMGCSLLWLISVCVGNSIEIEVKKGWTENASVWLSLVGKAGIGKTPSINNIVFPLQKINSREIKKYYKEMEKFDAYNSLPPKEKKESLEVSQPSKSQFIANDITLEALVDLHQDSDNVVGVFKDELAGWLKDMNKYRAGSDLEFWLSCWSGKSVSFNRKTAKSSFVEKPFIPVLGGIQPSILNSFYTEENKDNGFMDRMLLSFPDSVIELYNENEMEYEVLDWYKENIVSFYDTLKRIIKRDSENSIIPLTAVFLPEAKEEWKRIFNKISNFQNDDNENEYLKSMYPKQKSYIPRFSLLIHVFDEFFSDGGNSLGISKESVLKAEKLSNYFIATAKKVKMNSIEINSMKTIILNNKNKSIKEQFIEIYKKNPDINKKDVSENLGVSVQMIYKYIKELNKN